MEKYRKHIRLDGYDYASNGYYFVTVCSSGRKRNCRAFQEIIERHLKNLADHGGVRLDYVAVMPDHVHFIVILHGAKIPLFRLIQEFKSRTTIEIKKSGFTEKRFWQQNYYEHVIRNDRALQRIREYIENNPLAENPDWVKIYAGL